VNLKNQKGVPLPSVLADAHSLFTVPTGTTRATGRIVRESFPAPSGNGQTYAFPPLVSGSCWAEPLINQAYLAAVCRSIPSALATA
jgi:hypothetical protein